jgi:cleavage and polyadenylation specificity factor subunit 3
MLDEYWKENKEELKDIEIYYAGSAAIKGIKIFQTFINMMGDTVKDRNTKGKNPFEFDHITCVPNIESFEFKDPVVVMTGPGMLQNGPSRNLFEKWCTDPKNGVVITGYSVEGTLANKLLKETNSEVECTNGKEVLFYFIRKKAKNEYIY